MKKSTGNLKANFVYNLLSQILSLITPLITAPYLARVLQETGNGRYSFTMSIVTYFVLFANLGFNIYGQREISRLRNDLEKQKKTFLEIISLRFILTMISVIILFSICFTVGFGEGYNELIMIESINVFAVIIDFTFFYQGQEDFRTVAIRNIIVKILSVTSIFIFVRSSNDVWVYALCMGIDSLITSILMMPGVIKRFHGVNSSKLNLKKHIKPALQIFLPTLAVTVYSVFDKTMIGMFATNSDYENGCYEQAYKINSICLTFVTALAPVYVPRNTFDYANKNYDALKNHMITASNYVWMISLPMIVGTFVLANNMCSWFLGDGYVEVPLLIQVMSLRLVLSGFGTTFGDMYFIPIGKEKYATIATFSAAIVNVVLNYFFIKNWGALGASITTVISEFLVTSILIILAIKEKIVPVKQIFINSWKYILSALIMFIPVFFLNKMLDYSIISFLVCVIVGAIIYFLCLFMLKDKFVLEMSRNIFIKIKSKFDSFFEKLEK